MPAAIIGGVAAVGSAVIGSKAAKKQAQAAEHAADVQAEALHEQNEIAREQLGLAREQFAIGKEQWDRWKRDYLPMEEEFISESRGMGSIANQNRNAQQAAADVASGFAQVRERLNEIPVNSPDARLREESRINLTEAATSAAAQTGAREATRATGRAAKTDAISLGRNLPATAATGMAQAVSGMGAAAGGMGNVAAGMGSAARFHQQGADNTATSVGKAIGGITQSKGFQDWINGFGAPNIAGSAGGNMDFPEWGSASGATGAWT